MMAEFEFFMDVSPKWWIQSRKDELLLKKYICEKFDNDFYPRKISQGRKLIDLDEENNLKSILINKLKTGKFNYEFLPEDESLKESYFIVNGHVSIHPRRKLTNSRLLIKTTI